MSTPLVGTLGPDEVAPFNVSLARPDRVGIISMTLCLAALRSRVRQS